MKLLAAFWVVAHATNIGAAPELDAAIQELMSAAPDAARVVVGPVGDNDEERSARLQQQVVQALRVRGREEVLTPAMVQEALDAAASAALERGDPAVLGDLSADHVILGTVLDAGNELALELRLLDVESGRSVSQQTVTLSGARAASSVGAPSVRQGIDDAAVQLQQSLGALPGNPRYQRIAVLPLDARGDAVTASGADRLAQSQLTAALDRAGYLVVERGELSAALDQMALGAALGEESAPQLGKLLDAQAIVFGAVADAGDVFALTLRVVSTESAVVLGTASAELPRDGVVTLAEGMIETRTPAEAAVRSAVVPGWGQVYNREGGKAVVFASTALLALGVTAALGTSGALTQLRYRDYAPVPGTTPQAASGESEALRQQANGLYLAAGASAAVTAAVWAGSAVDALFTALRHE
ncbi:MAG: FlgO family outer membrane protein [Myxococcota bacterium]